MSLGDTQSQYAAIASLGRKIGIPNLAVEDFDLIYADAHEVDKFCDQFDSLDLSPNERFFFMQLIVASLDEALRKALPSASLSAQRVERLLLRDVTAFQYIIDYWGRIGEGADLPIAPMMLRLGSRGAVGDGA